MFKYYGIDWLANILFALYIWIVATNPRMAQWIAIVASVLGIACGFLAGSWGNVAGSVFFLILYFRAAIMLKKKESL